MKYKCNLQASRPATRNLMQRREKQRQGEWRANIFFTPLRPAEKIPLPFAYGGGARGRKGFLEINICRSERK